MTLILQIAAGIVLAMVILAFWRQIAGLGLLLAVGAIGLLVLGLGIAGLLWVGGHRREIEDTVVAWIDSNTSMAIGFALTGVAVLLVWLIPQLMKKNGRAGPSDSDTDKSGEHH